MPSDYQQRLQPTPTPTLAVRYLAAAGDFLISILAVILIATSFSAKKYPEAYLFPRILAVVLLLLCAAQLVIVARGSEVAEDIAAIFADLKNTLPLVGLIIVYILLAEWLGFYISAALAYFAVALVGGGRYDFQQITITAAIALGVTTGLYVLFSLLLQVQSPRGLLF